MAVTIDLEGRVAVVTGGAGGIGEAIARTLAEAGAAVALLDRDADRLERLAALGPGVAVDVGDAASVAAGIRAVEERVGPVDVLVNSAGIASARLGMPFTNQSVDDWQRTFTVNVVGTFHAAQAVAPAMLERGRGAIVNVASVSGRTGFQTDPAYSASKAAVLNFTQAMARDLAPAVRVNAVCPGMVFTPFYAAQHAAAIAGGATQAATAEEYFEEKASRLIPLRRGQQPQDVASAVLFLASDLASSITGQALNVDGGLVMS
jgi:2-hydroxycyclohexanecarboxyl-CoA dehydrogenase